MFLRLFAWRADCEVSDSELASPMAGRLEIQPGLWVGERGGRFSRAVVGLVLVVVEDDGAEKEDNEACGEDSRAR